MLASAGFAFYVANFSSYSKIYGALAGPIVFLLWLWISNICILLGAELNAELERSRKLEAGEVSREDEQFVETRDTDKLDEGRCAQCAGAGTRPRSSWRSPQPDTSAHAASSTRKPTSWPCHAS